MSIATDTARGLAYLHTADKKNPLVHRDVKRYSGGYGMVGHIGTKWNPYIPLDLASPTS